MDYLTTPRTPTASAWLALMDDDLDEDRHAVTKAPTEAKEETNSTSNLWVYPFCSIIPHNCAEEESIPGKRFFPSTTSTNAENNLAGVSDEDSKGAETQNFLQQIQTYYDCLQATTFSKIAKIEQDINDHIEKVESPCKMLRNKVDSVFYEYDEEFIDNMESEGDESLIIVRNESPDIFHELKESIPYLRERNNTFTSSKYKDFIESHATTSGSDSSSNTRSLHPGSQKQKLSDDSSTADRQPSPRKFPASDSFDQFNNGIAMDKITKEEVSISILPDSVIKTYKNGLLINTINFSITGESYSPKNIFILEMPYPKGNNYTRGYIEFCKNTIAFRKSYLDGEDYFFEKIQ